MADSSDLKQSGISASSMTFQLTQPTLRRHYELSHLNSTPIDTLSLVCEETRLMKIRFWIVAFVSAVITLLTSSMSFSQTAPSSGIFVNNLMPQPVSLTIASGGWSYAGFSRAVDGIRRCRLEEPSSGPCSSCGGLPAFLSVRRLRREAVPIDN